MWRRLKRAEDSRILPKPLSQMPFTWPATPCIPNTKLPTCFPYLMHQNIILNDGKCSHYSTFPSTDSFTCFVSFARRIQHGAVESPDKVITESCFLHQSYSHEGRDLKSLFSVEQTNISESKVGVIIQCFWALYAKGQAVFNLGGDLMDLKGISSRM